MSTSSQKPADSKLDGKDKAVSDSKSQQNDGKPQTPLAKKDADKAGDAASDQKSNRSKVAGSKLSEDHKSARSHKSNADKPA